MSELIDTFGEIAVGVVLALLAASLVILMIAFVGKGDK